MWTEKHLKWTYETSSYPAGFAAILGDAYDFQCVKFAVPLSEISVDEVYPLYGPAAGGTRVVIYGQYLSVTSVYAVYIGHYKLYLDPNRLR